MWRTSFGAALLLVACCSACDLFDATGSMDKSNSFLFLDVKPSVDVYIQSIATGFLNTGGERSGATLHFKRSAYTDDVYSGWTAINATVTKDRFRGLPIFNFTTSPVYLQGRSVSSFRISGNSALLSIRYSGSPYYQTAVAAPGAVTDGVLQARTGVA